jgi:hypothetical protein
MKSTPSLMAWRLEPPDDRLADDVMRELAQCARSGTGLSMSPSNPSAARAVVGR